MAIGNQPNALPPTRKSENPLIFLPETLPTQRSMIMYPITTKRRMSIYLLQPPLAFSLDTIHLESQSVFLTPPPQYKKWGRETSASKLLAFCYNLSGKVTNHVSFWWRFYHHSIFDRRTTCQNEFSVYSIST